MAACSHQDDLQAQNEDSNISKSKKSKQCPRSPGAPLLYGTEQKDSELFCSDDDDDDDEFGEGFLVLEKDTTPDVKSLFVETEKDVDDVFFGFAQESFTLPDLDWSEREIAHPIREFTAKPGPTRKKAPGKNAIDYFNLFFTDELLERTRKWTNLNAERKIKRDPENNKGKWSEIEDIQEIRAFIALLIFIEIFWNGRIEELWNTRHQFPLFDIPGVRKIFSRNRFAQILRYLHFCDEDKLQNTPGHQRDKLGKVRPLLNYLRRKFMEEYMPSQEVAIDECMVPFRGRLSMRQYEKAKPVKWGIKVWMLAESTTGYNYNFEVYCGRNEEVRQYPTMGLSSRVVLQLTEPLANMGHHIYIDSFYTSPILLYALQSRKLYAAGTTIPTHMGYPQQLKREKKDMARGEYAWLMDAKTGMVATVWRDNRLVYYLSTIHVPEVSGMCVNRYDVKSGEYIDLPATPVVVDYNQYMGGVDYNDRMTVLNQSRKTYHWYVRLVRKCILWAAFNAYIIEGHFEKHKTPGKRKRDFRSFVIQLMHQLIGDFSTRRAARGKIGKRPSRMMADDHNPVVGEGSDHTCAVCYKKYKKFTDLHPKMAYKDLPYKRVKTSFKCTACDVYLCLKRGSTCWHDYHRKMEYWR